MPALRLALLSAPALITQAPVTAAEITPVETIVVIGDAPLPGGVDPAKLPGETETLSVPVLTRDRQTNVLPNAIATQLSSVNLNDEQGSQFQPDFVYRGFEASPISGVAEGVAVYQDGVRLNEALGDNVNWDLVPEFAVEQFTLQSNNPVFGLNALGGAVSLQMKSGLSFQGSHAELGGGSFGNVTGDAEYGARSGPFAVYFSVGGVHDDGFRYRSPTALRQAYGDAAYENDGLTLHLSATAALNDIAAVGPTPVELLRVDRRAIFTYPQSMRNEMGLVQFHGTYRASRELLVSFSAYYRHYEQHLIDGNTTDVQHCQNDTDQLCLEGDNLYPDDALYDAKGNPVPASVLPAGATPGETDFTRTNTNALGGAIQLSSDASIASRANNLVVGASVDHGSTQYSAHGELGALLDSLGVVGTGIIIDQSQSPAASPPIETPISIEGNNTYTGVYVINVLDVTRSLSWSLSGRLNIAEISLRDRLGAVLTGDHTFTRFNPGTGLTYRFSKSISLYAGYSESNRAPTAGELSCADPTSPCLLDAFLVSDPDLEQVVARNYELGLRGRMENFFSGTVTWNVSAYRAAIAHDILLLATDINGFGFFHNAGTTRHQGIDLHVNYRSKALRLSASYAHLDATFRNAEVLSSNSPAADADGIIQVRPGDRIPMNPDNRLTLSADYDITGALAVGTDLRWQSGQYLVGDESNEQPKLPGFTTVDLHGSYKIGRRFSLFVEITNLFDHRYYTYGAFASLNGLPPSLSLSDSRTLSPATPRIFFAGFHFHIE